MRNFLATLFLSQGVPMLCGGDEIGRTQQGNNNAYCQDNEISWYDWEHADQQLLGFTRDLIRLRSEHPVFRRRRWFQGRPIRGSDVSDIGWFTPGGTEMSDAGLAGRLRQVARRLPQRRRHPDARRARASASSTTAST